MICGSNAKFNEASRSVVKRREEKRGEMKAVAFHQRLALSELAAIFSLNVHFHQSPDAISGYGMSRRRYGFRRAKQAQFSISLTVCIPQENSIRRALIGVPC